MGHVLKPAKSETCAGGISVCSGIAESAAEHCIFSVKTSVCRRPDELACDQSKFFEEFEMGAKL